MDYLLPTASEVPPIEIIHLETPSQVTPGGIKGMGESAMIAAPAAIIGGINDAIAPLGAFITEVPATPDRILAVLDRT
jgi:carbon-monoxide dehydrogenase large subunit